MFRRSLARAAFAAALSATALPAAAQSASGRGPAAAAPAPTLSLARALALAEAYSPSLKAARERVRAAGADVEAAGAFYYPHLVAAAATGTGLAGSQGAAPDGVGGVIASPYAAGPRVGADVSASWDVLDVGATLARSAAKATRVSAREQERFTRVQVDQSALIGYMDACRLRGEEKIWARQCGRLETLYAKVAYYESVGRYSVVQLLLLKEMLADARLERARAGQALADSLADLAITLGVPAQGLAVPPPESLDPALPAVGPETSNPLLSYALARAAAARPLAQAAGAQALPRVFANASVGDVDRTLVVPARDYSASVGVALPLFEGFQVKAGYEGALALARAEERLSEDTGLTIAHADNRYDDAEALDRLSVASLAARRTDALVALEQARIRYLRLIGPLSDLQQALVNIVAIEVQDNAARADLLANTGAQRLFNGAVPEP